MIFMQDHDILSRNRDAGRAVASPQAGLRVSARTGSQANTQARTKASTQTGLRARQVQTGLQASTEAGPKVRHMHDRDVSQYTDKMRDRKRTG